MEKDGKGATNLIRKFLLSYDRPTEIVEHTLLSQLNDILAPDLTISRILCKELENNIWEVFLEEPVKGQIALSQSGSGLKTLILVLVLLRLVPREMNKPLDHFVFAFEELENNLHPAMLRRLLNFLYRVATTEGCVFALTTHSNVEIDFFSTKPETQIIHVVHDGKSAVTRTVLDYQDCQEILNDLGIRASDLLQSNGVLWVEGPSDRFYLNKWIELWSDGELQEGLHYQCVFYGGRLLSHLSGDMPDPGLDCDPDWIKILWVNRNSAILIDSDKAAQSSRINATKKRIIREFESRDSIAWITKGREIENYLPVDMLESLFNIELNSPGLYDDVPTMIQDKLKKKTLNKSSLATNLVPLLTRENCAQILDLDHQMNELCNAIRKWNSTRSH